MNTFFDTVMAILNGQAEIETLPTAQLRAHNKNHCKLTHSVPRDTIIKIARLQELIFRQKEFEYDCIEDAARRTALLEQLIVEIVRKEIPTECGHEHVNYILNRDRSLQYVPFGMHSARN